MSEKKGKTDLQKCSQSVIRQLLIWPPGPNLKDIQFTVEKMCTREDELTVIFEDMQPTNVYHFFSWLAYWQTVSALDPLFLSLKRPKVAEIKMHWATCGYWGCCTRCTRRQSLWAWARYLKYKPKCTVAMTSLGDPTCHSSWSHPASSPSSPAWWSLRSWARRRNSAVACPSPPHSARSRSGWSSPYASYHCSTHTPGSQLHPDCTLRLDRRPRSARSVMTWKLTGGSTGIWCPVRAVLRRITSKLSL